jgi:hypothetical protein
MVRSRISRLRKRGTETAVLGRISMATPNDPIHPLCFADTLADAISHASFVKLAPKQLNDGPHIEEVNSHLFQFLDSVCAHLAPAHLRFCR